MSASVQPIPLSPEICADAAAWVAKLHSSGRTHALEAALHAWMLEDPVHARAFELATQAWELGGALPSTSLPRIGLAGRRERPRMSWRPALAAVAIAALAIGGVFYWRDPTYATGVGEQRSVVLEDGTRVTLNTASKLSVHFTKAERGIRLEAGEAFFDVAKSPHRPLIVTAGSESVVAVGTAFSVRRDGQTIEVTLVEGTVRVAPAFTPDSGPAPAAGPQILSPGQRLRVAGAQQKLDQPNIEAVTAWRRGEVVLDHTRLADAVAEMNRYSAIPLIVSAPEAATIEVSGIFRAGDSLRFASAVAETYGIGVKEEPGRILLAGAPRKERPAEP